MLVLIRLGWLITLLALNRTLDIIFHVINITTHNGINVAFLQYLVNSHANRIFIN